MRKVLILLGCGLVGSLAGNVWADTYFVPDHYDSLQYALDGVAAGDTVIVRDGVWMGPANRNLDFGGKDLVLRSQNGADHCTIDAEGTPDFGNRQRHIHFHSGETSATVVAGFTFIGGWIRFSGDGLDGAYGGSILCQAGASPTIRGCVFEGNHGYRGGSIAGVSGAAPRLEACEFLDNQASQEADVPGLNGGGAVLFYEAGEVVITGCTFSGNDGIIGGGLYYWEGDGLTVSDCRFESNIAKAGGGIDVRETSLVIENSDFFENHADWLTGNAGGLAVHDCDDAVVTGCEFRGNRAWYAGGLFISGLRVDVNNCLFIGNEANSRGGGVRWYAASGEMSDCIISGNTAHVGAGIYLQYGWPTFTRCTITGNHAEGEGGGCCSERSLYFYYNILWGNTCDDPEYGPQMAIWGGGRVRVDNCVVQGDSTAVYLEEPGHSEYLWGENNLAVDPQFCSSQCDLDEWWALQIDSPCLSPSGQIGAVGAECGETPTWLSGFTAQAESDGVRLEWSLVTAVAAGDFRLTGHRGDQSWPVPHLAVTAAGFTAFDKSPGTKSPGEIVYRLKYRSGPDQWSRIAERAVTPQVIGGHSRIVAISPNPFNPSTTIAFDLVKTGPVEMVIYDLTGTRVRILIDGIRPAGRHSAIWDGQDADGSRVASGVYLARLKTGEIQQMQKMMLVK